MAINRISFAKDLRSDVLKWIGSMNSLVWNAGFSEVETSLIEDTHSVRVIIRDLSIIAKSPFNIGSKEELSDFVYKLIWGGLSDFFNDDNIYNSLNRKYWVLRSAFAIELGDFEVKRDCNYSAGDSVNVRLKKIEFKVYPLAKSFLDYNLNDVDFDLNEKIGRVFDDLDNERSNALNGGSFELSGNGLTLSFSLEGNIFKYWSNSGDDENSFTMGIGRPISLLKIKADKSALNDEDKFINLVCDLFLQDDENTYPCLQFLDSTPEDLFYDQLYSFGYDLWRDLREDLLKKGEVTLSRDELDFLNIHNALCFMTRLDLDEA